APPHGELWRERNPANHAGPAVRKERPGPVRLARQCLGMVSGPVWGQGKSPARRRVGLGRLRLPSHATGLQYPRLQVEHYWLPSRLGGSSESLRERVGDSPPAPGQPAYPAVCLHFRHIPPIFLAAAYPARLDAPLPLQLPPILADSYLIRQGGQV